MQCEKPLIDERQIRQLQLPNGISVTLISDSRSEKSSCALSIGFGAAKDSFPGIAHMTEHAVFLGSKKYPEENAYKKFLSKHGGGSNGATGMEYTSFKFFVNADSFEPALDIFSQFFKAPLLSQDSIQREVHAVDSEDSKNRILDNRRTLQVLKDIMNPKTSYSKFSTGNLNTLAFGLVEENGKFLTAAVREFHQQHYDPRKMNLCLVGPQNLDELNRLASELFSNIQCSGSDRHTCSSQSSQDDSEKYGTRELFEITDDHHLLVQFRPSKDIRDIHFMWELPFDPKLYRSDPSTLISYLLNQREEGTLLATLQDLGLATAVSGSYRTTFTDPASGNSFAIYQIGVSLTEQGLTQWRLVQRYVMDTLKLISDLSPEKIDIYWKEIQSITTLSFAFQSQPSAYEQAASAVSNMLNYDPHHVLSGEDLVDNIDIPRFHDYCQRLITQSQVIFIRSRSIEGLPDCDDKDFIRTAMNAFDHDNGGVGNTGFTVEETRDNDYRRSLYFSLLRDYLHFQRRDKSEINTSTIWKELFYGISYLAQFIPIEDVCGNNLKRIQLQNPSRFICKELLDQVCHNPQLFRERLSSRKLHSAPPTMCDFNAYFNSDSSIASELKESKSPFMWVSQDEIFATPKSVFHLFIPRVIPENSESNVHPRNFLLNVLFSQIITREFGDAYSGGLSVEVSWSRRGLSIRFYGYSEGIFNFAKLVLFSLLGISVSPQGEILRTENGLWRSKVTPLLFNNFKEKQLRGLRSWKQTRPDSQAQSILAYLLHEGEQMPEHMIGELEATDMKELFLLEDEIKSLLLNYISATLREESTRQSGVAHLHGSLNTEEGKNSLFQMFSSVLNTFEGEISTKACELPSYEIVKDRTRILPKGQHTVISLPAINEQDPNHAYVLFIQTEQRSPRNGALMLLLRRLWAEPAFNTLRTQQQLGYIVSFSTEGYGRGRYGIRGFELKVLSKRFNPIEIEASVESFFTFQTEKLKNGGVTEAEIKEIAQSIIKSLRDPPTSYLEEGNEFWSSIANEFPFDWQEQVINKLNDVSLTDLQEFVSEFVANSNSRKSVAVHIYGATDNASHHRSEYLSVVDSTKFLGSPVQCLSSIDEIDPWRKLLSWSEKGQL